MQLRTTQTTFVICPSIPIPCYHHDNSHYHQHPNHHHHSLQASNFLSWLVGECLSQEGHTPLVGGGRTHVPLPWSHFERWYFQRSLRRPTSSTFYIVSLDFVASQLCFWCFSPTILTLAHTKVKSTHVPMYCRNKAFGEAGVLCRVKIVT